MFVLPNVAKTSVALTRAGQIGSLRPTSPSPKCEGQIGKEVVWGQLWGQLRRLIFRKLVTMRLPIIG